MKRYAVFYYDNFYPSGGWHDFAGSFADHDEAFEQVLLMAGKEFRRNGGLDQIYHVVDLETGSQVGKIGYDGCVDFISEELGRKLDEACA